MVAAFSSITYAFEVEKKTKFMSMSRKKWLIFNGFILFFIVKKQFFFLYYFAYGIPIVKYGGMHHKKTAPYCNQCMCIVFFVVSSM